MCSYIKVKFYPEVKSQNGLGSLWVHPHSKQLFTGYLYDACTKFSDIVLIKIMTSTPGVEIRIAFLICYLQSLYKIELDHYFCPEFM